MIAMERDRHTQLRTNSRTRLREISPWLLTSKKSCVSGDDEGSAISLQQALANRRFGLRSILHAATHASSANGLPQPSSAFSLMPDTALLCRQIPPARQRDRRKAPNPRQATDSLPCLAL